jgi:hypothetical protein
MTEYKKYDTFATTTYFVRLAQDAKVFARPDGGEDVVVTFCDNTRIAGTEDLWVDARVTKFLTDRAKGYRKGDEVQVSGKLRFKKQDDGSIRGKIYDATVNSFISMKDRGIEYTPRTKAGAGEDPVPPAFA